MNYLLLTKKFHDKILRINIQKAYSLSIITYKLKNKKAFFASVVRKNTKPIFRLLMGILLILNPTLCKKLRTVTSI